MNGVLPVASSSVSYGVTAPSSLVTVFALRIDVDDARADAQLDVVAAVPLERIEDDLVGAFSPASTDDSRIRL